MRLTVRLSTAAQSGFLSMPTVESGESLSLPDGSVDEAKARRALSRCPGVTFSDRDDACVIGFAVEFLERIRIAFERLTASDTGVRKDSAETTESKAARRFRKGRFAFVRLDITRTSGKLKLRLSYGNPREVVGIAEEFASSLAQVFADNLAAIAEDLGPEKAAVLEFSEGENCEGIFARAAERSRRARLLAMRSKCPRLVNGFCSPMKPECPCYRAGRCEISKGDE